MDSSFIPGRRFLALSIFLIALALLPCSPAADNTWTNTGGGFAWDTTTGNWTNPAIWNNNYFNADAAVFGSAGVGSITVAAGINAQSLNFTTSGYTLTGGTITLSQFGTGTLLPGQIGVGGNTAALSTTTATINSNIISAIAGLNKVGDGTLILGGAANSFTGFTAIGNSGFGTNVLIGSATTTNFGGSLKLGSATALPATTTVGIGFGFLDIQNFNVTLAGITFANTKANQTFPGTPDNGVIGTGTLSVTGPIRAVGNTTGWGNFIGTPVSAGGGTLRLEIGNSGNGARDIQFLQPISNGSLFRTFGVDSNGRTTAGGMTLFANNTFTGSGVFNGGTNIVGGANASTVLRVVNGALTLQGVSCGFSAAATVSVVSGGTLTLSNVDSISGGNAPPLAAGDPNNRLGTSGPHSP